MITAWIVGILGIAAGAAAWIAVWRHGGRSADLGVVSTQWIAEQRFGRGSDSRN